MIDLNEIIENKAERKSMLTSEIRALKSPKIQALLKQHPDADSLYMTASHLYLNVDLRCDDEHDLLPIATDCDSEHRIAYEERTLGKIGRRTVKLNVRAYQRFSEEEKALLRALGKIRKESYDALTCS